MGDNATREGDYLDGDPDVEDSRAVAAGDEEARACSQRDESDHPSDSDGSVNSSDSRGVVCPRAQNAVSQAVPKQDAILSLIKKPVGSNPGLPPNASAADDLKSSSPRRPTVPAERVCQDGGDSGLREEEEEEEAERRELMQYAEVLYKCALCTTLPCILTSEASFLAHVREQHLNVPHEPKCRHCRLHFATPFDLAEHAARVHQEISEDNCDSDDTCDSILREEPGVLAEKTDRFSPQQVRDSSDPEDSDVDGRKTSSPSRSDAKTPTNDSLYRLQKLAEQILQSQVSRREALNGFAVQAVSAASFHASFTPEFGRYTKLVREGGNIVYFCQVCNVKCQVKAAFHVHCNGIHHHNKVRLADKNSKDGAGSDGAFSPSPSKTSPPARAKEGHVTPNHVVPRATLLKVPLVPHSSERLTSDPTSTFRQDSVKVGRSAVDSAVGQPASTPTKVTPEEPRLTAATVRDSPVCQVNVVRSLNETSDSDLSTDDKSALSFDHWSRAHSNLGHRKRRKSQAPKAVRGRTCASPERLSSGEVSVDAVTAVAVGSDKENSENCSRKGVALASSPNGPRELSPALNHRVAGVSDESRDLQKFVKLEHAEESCFLSGDSKSFQRGQPVYSSSDEEMAELKSEAGQLGTRKRKLFEDEVESVEEAEADEGHAQSARVIYPCPLCGFHADDPQLQEKHYLLVHNMNIGSEVTLVDGLGGHNNEGWKVMKIRELLPGLIEESPRGSVARDLLLQRISMLLDHPHAVTWGPACNRAVREEHPHSVAQRKGKFKKTYFFGVSLIQRRGEEEEEEDVEEFESLTARPLRDMTQDLEQILENLPCLLRWTGHVQKGVSRDEVLRALAEHVGEAEVQHWGVQCNRAVRMLFPHVEMKRKGKYKTTVYFGVGFTSDKQSSEKVVDTAATSPVSNKPERSWFSSSGITQIPSHAWAAYLLSFGHKLH